jgi:uncharacterized protein YjeT (DUF2065 family)
MLIRFAVQVAGFGLLYALVLLATFPFLVYFGKPKPWQKVAEFLLSFPIDNEKLGLFSFAGTALVVLGNGLLWGIVAVGTGWLSKLVISNL